MLQSKRWAGSAPVVVVSALLLGCGGGGSDADQIKQAVLDYNGAAAKQDGAKACGFLTSSGQELLAGVDINSLTSGGTASCKSAITNLKSLKGAGDAASLKFAKVTDVQIRGSTARVTLENSDPPQKLTAYLEKSGDGWKISRPPGF